MSPGRTAKAAQPLQIPDRLRAKLAGDEATASSVKRTLLKFSPWLQASGMPFFPGFTDHGPGHLSRVLDTATWLIAEKAWKVMTARDAGCLILAVLLHDIAMHLTQDSFRALLREGDQKTLIPALDARNWGSLWSDFLLEARHWNGAKREEVFGTAGREYQKTVLAKLTSGNLDDLGEADCLLIGEWLRRHHPRLAHEIALSGVPRLDEGERLQIDVPESCPALGDLAGLVARSHGMSLRETFSYLDRKYHGRRRIQEVHPVFLMTLVRIADYLDLHAERAPEGLLQVKVLSSAISRREWEAHQAITDIRYDSSDDPDRIEVIAEPESARSYKHVWSWVTGVQKELDHAWAVLGEVYGGREPYAKLGMRVRRITSPLENVEEFARLHELPYLPDPARFTISGGELLNLLVKPLYGDEPRIGIRELLQNAVDAVNEREAYKPGSANPGSLPLGANVLVSICQREESWPPPEALVPEEWQFWVEVSDSGIGMTSRTVYDYFLCVGASLRRSLDWIRAFTANGQSKVLRSGRFGIGVLAAFLLGDEIQVVTRHVDEPDLGIGFRARLDQESIELRRVARDIGTTVRVRIDETMALRLASNKGWPEKDLESWRWYYLAKPRLVRIIRIKGKTQVLEDSNFLPSPGDPPGRWRPIRGTNFDTVMWNDGREGHYYHHRIYCNGIFVYEGHARRDRPLLGSISQLQEPAVSVFDREGEFPLKITRDGLQEGLSFILELRRDVLIDHCAWLLFEAGLSPEIWSPFAAPMWRYDEFFLGQGDGKLQGSVYALTTTGLVPLHGWHLWASGTDQLTAEFNFGKLENRLVWEAVASGRFPSPLARIILEPYGGFGESPDVPALQEITYFTRDLGWRSATWSCAISKSFWISESSHRVFMHRTKAECRRNSKSRLMHYTTASTEDSEELFTLLRELNSSPPEAGGERNGVIRFYFDRENPEPADDDFVKVWRELGLPPVIPYDTEERVRQCRAALPALAAYLDRYAMTVREEKNLEVLPWWR